MPYELIYASWVAANLDHEFVLGLVRQSRDRNRRLGITGLLVFDGERFCHLLEGEMEVVGILAAAIAHDPRHNDYTVLHAAPQSGGRRFAGWHLGFAMHEPNALSGVISRRTGVQMADYLQATSLERIDIG